MTSHKDDHTLHCSQRVLLHSIACGRRPSCRGSTLQDTHVEEHLLDYCRLGCGKDILAEGAIALSVTLSGGALFAS